MTTMINQMNLRKKKTNSKRKKLKHKSKLSALTLTTRLEKPCSTGR